LMDDPGSSANLRTFFSPFAWARDSTFYVAVSVVWSRFLVDGFVLLSFELSMLLPFAFFPVPW
jgi:hypothetical protein